MKKIETVRKTVARQKKMGLLIIAVGLSIVYIAINLFLANGSRLSLLALTLGFIFGIVVLIHKSETLTSRDAFGWGACLISCPIWVGFYLGTYEGWLQISFLLGYGYLETLVYLPIQDEYQRIKVFIKSG